MDRPSPDETRAPLLGPDKEHSMQTYDAQIRRQLQNRGNLEARKIDHLLQNPFLGYATSELHG